MRSKQKALTFKLFTLLVILALSEYSFATPTLAATPNHRSEVEKPLVVEAAEVQASRGTITGTVVDETGMTVIGATVVITELGKGMMTDMDGNFNLSGIPDGTYTLRITYIGYHDYESEPLLIEGGNTIRLDITLLEDSELLEEVVVVGYGTQKKVNLTGAVAQVGGEVFDKRPITNVSQGLVGVIPNLNVSLTDGKPTNSPSFNVRGVTSIGQGGSALVLVDGVEGDPRMLNPNDIESISVLKDAASASIYGARAAFGVVLITTKQASKGKASISYTANFSSKRPTTVPDNVVEPYLWAKSFADAYMNWNANGVFPGKVNKTMIFSKEYLDDLKRHSEDPSLPKVEIEEGTGRYIYYDSTDWYKELYKDSYFSQDHNLSVSGGNDFATYYLSGRYNGEDGLFRYNTDKYSMYNLRGRGTIRVFPWLLLDNNTTYSAMKYHQPINVGEGSNIWRNIADEGNPLAPLTNPDGTLSFPSAYTVGDMYLGKNYADLTQNSFHNKTALTATFFDNSLDIKADFTYQRSDYRHIRNRAPVPYSQYQGVISYVGSDNDDFQEQTRMTTYTAANFYADYHKSFLDRTHNLGVLIGYNQEQSLSKSLTATRNGLLFDDAEDINMALGDNISTGGGYQRWQIAGVFGRINYDYKDRYLLELNGRYDGSSKFPTQSQWSFFPSVSAGWRVTEEPWWHVDESIISLLKLRVSYGSLGNGSIGAYRFIETFNISKSDRVLEGARPQKTSQPSVIPSSLTWERATTGNIGLDINFLKNRLQLTTELYRRWTTDMYTKGPTLPAIFGTREPYGNYASLETTGWEITLTYMDQVQLGGKPLNYTIRGTVADSRAFITDYNNDDKVLTDYYIGQEIGEIWGYQVEGLFRSEEEIAKSPTQKNIRAHSNGVSQVGDLKFRNLDGDNIISQGNNRVGDSGDKSIIGNSAPHYTYSIFLSGDWNNIFVSAFFQGVGKQQWYPSVESRFWGQYNRPYNDYPAWQQDRQFRPELQNFDAYLPLISGYSNLGSGRALNAPVDRYLQDVSYIRLKTLTVGYTLPSHWAKAMHASSLSIQFSGENLWTWSPMYRLTRDTDVTSIWGGGTQLTGLNSDSTMSNDGYNYPLLKSFSLGFTVNL